MKEVLGELDGHLQQLRADYYAVLQPPLPAAEIARLQQYYKLILPDDLLALYQWKNGQPATCYESFADNCMLLPLEEALDTAAELTSMIDLDFELKHWWHQQWIPLLHNGGGDYICYDLAGLFTGDQGQLITFWHADKDRNVIAPGLETFITALNASYRGKNAAELDEYFKPAAIKGYPRSFKAG